MTRWFDTADRFTDPVGARRIAQFVDLLGRFPVGHLVDLGAGHGIFSKVAVELGWTVTAVDVRDSRFPDDKAIRWVVSDIREFDDYGDATVVACLGLWYHLTLQDQLDLARKVAPRALILDTHVAVPELPAYQLPNRARISDVTEHGGYVGRLYDESDLQDRATASWGNDTSFWPSVPSLERQMYQAGYEVFEQICPPYRPDRGYFVARSLANGTDHARLDDIVAKYDPVVRPDAPATAHPTSSFVPELATAPVARTVPAKPQRTPNPAAPKIPPVRVAASQLVTSLRRSVKQRVSAGRANRRSG